MHPNPHEPLTNPSARRSADVQDSAAGAVQRLLDRPLTDEDLAAAAQQVSQPLQVMEKQVRRLLLFRVSGEDLALETSAVVGVMRSASVHRIPHRSNKIVRGLCNVEGDLLLCGDLAALLQLGATESPGDEASPSRRMIVVGDDLERWVVEADSVQGVVQVVPDTFRKPPVTVDAALGRYISHLVPLEKRSAALIDHARLAAGFQAALS
ncbi:MAG: chemotaxis protein CheW [Planctomycetota bacterium]|nr:chemotaxis protein CheW [Planctomycetota bacterium]